MAAMVAKETGAPVQGHGAVATRAIGVPATVVAQQHRGVTAPVAEHQGLLTARQADADRIQQGAREAMLGALSTQVEHVDPRCPRAGRALAQLQPGIAPAAGVLESLEAGRGAAQQYRNPAPLGAHQGEVTRVVAETVLLLVGGVVLLVDHHQTQLRQGRKHRRAGADQHPRLAARHQRMGARPLAIGQAGMQHVDRYRQVLAIAPDGLRGQADLGHQHQRLLSLREAVFDRGQVDLGLAAAGDAFQQGHPEAPRQTGDRSHGCLLRRGQGRRGPSR